MNRKGFAALCIILSVLVLVFTTNNAWAPTVYSASAAPATINLTQKTIINVTISGGALNTPYDFDVVVTKPLGGGVQTARVSFMTDGSGAGRGAVTYWDPLRWSGTGSIYTDLEGAYQIQLNKINPNPTQNNVAPPAQFAVDKRLTVAISSPVPGSALRRGTPVTITVAVNYIDGRQNSNAAVTATTPLRATTALTLTSPGIYSTVFNIQLSDPLGPWVINATAKESGNTGSFAITVSVLAAYLVVTDLSTYNSFGNPTSDFSPGDSLYATFHIQYSGGGFLTSGSFNISIRNPSGKTVETLLTIYDPNRGLFYTPSGFQVSTSYPSGSWQLVFPAFSLNDTFGNTGPITPITYKFQIIQDQFAINPFYFILAALALGGGLTTTVFLKKFNTSNAPFEHLFKLTGGEMEPPASLMIIGDPGAGATTLGLQLLYRDLAAGKFCGLLSYDSFPSEIKRKMRDMGWDITPYLESGHLKILDCYSALAGVEGAPIRDATDFTEVSIQVTAMIERTTKGPTTILLDSVTPIFNSAAAKDCVNFLQVIGAKVKNNGGLFIFTATKGSIPEDARSKTESLADGVIELSLTRRAKSLARFLMVKKISGRQISSVETGFEIASGKGVLLRKQRIPVSLFQSR